MYATIFAAGEFPMPEKSQAAAMERLFQALADRTRLRLLNLMAGQEVCVCFFVEILDAPQPTISRHLAYLRRSGLVAARREGKWMHYRIAVPQSEAARDLLNGTLRWLGEDKDMQRDRDRLTRACCAPQKFVRLQAAPPPARVPESKLSFLDRT
jgi:ArsR family transcriptional regulator, arsenate/arsenite/antimonite-responsive transcriptional repressor